jgi:hypothetical protein
VQIEERPKERGVAAVRVKAVSFNNYMETTRALFAPEVVEAILAALPAKTRAELARKPLSTEWLAMEVVDGFNRALVQHGYNGDARRCVEFSRALVGRDLSGVYRVFIKMFSPEFVIARAGLLWNSYFKGNGFCTSVARKGEKASDVRVQDAVYMPEWLLHAMTGASLASLEATRAVNPRVTLVDHGPTHGHWLVQWGA